ncbi:MAG: LysR family transcriptional regulator [Acidimicrobiales bacterium]
MQLDTESLRTYLAVLQTGGMTSAATQLGISQSAVSWKIKRLEERVGSDLLVREGRSVRASSEGEQLLPYARTIVSAHDEAVARLTSSELTGRLRLGATEEVSADCVGTVVGRFNRIHPGVTIEVVVDRGQHLQDLLDRGSLDVALLQVTPEDERPGDTRLWEDDQLWISSPEWTYDEGVVPLVTFGESGFYRPLAEQLLAEAGIEHQVAFSGPSSASVIAAVEAGLGVAMLSGRSVSGDIIPWPRGSTLPPLPVLHQVARASKGRPSDIVSELIVDLVQELAEPDDLS